MFSYCYTPRMSEEALKDVLIRNQFYQIQHRSIMAVLLLLLVVMVFLLGFIYYQSNTNATPQYFPTAPDGRWIITPPVAEPQVVVDEQLITDPTKVNEAVINWARQAVVKVYELDFVHYRKTLQNVRDYFTAKGHAEFLKALQASNNLTSIQTRRQVVTAEIVGDAVIVRQGAIEIKEGWFKSHWRYRWNLKIPMVLTYQNAAKEMLKQNIMSSMVVYRVSTLESPAGLAIGQLVFEERV